MVLNNYNSLFNKLINQNFSTLHNNSFTDIIPFHFLQRTSTDDWHSSSEWESILNKCYFSRLMCPIGSRFFSLCYHNIAIPLIKWTVYGKKRKRVESSRFIGRMRGGMAELLSFLMLWSNQLLCDGLKRWIREFPKQIIIQTMTKRKKTKSRTNYIVKTTFLYP